MTEVLPDSVPTAVYQRKGEVTVEDRPLPVPDSGQVLVEVSYCGVCGSDLHLIDEGWGRPGDVLGHEWSGVIVGVGPGVTDYGVGDEVIGGPAPRCGVCEACLVNLPSQCSAQASMGADWDGAFATHVVRGTGHIRRIPEGLDRRIAALAEPLAVALHAVTRSGIVAGQPAMVLGAGPIGALIAATLVAEGHRVVVVEPAPIRQRLARAIGADEVRHPDELRMFNMAEVDTLADDAFPVVFDSSGRRAAIEAGFSQLARGGRLVMVGTGMEPPRFDPNRMIVLELSVTGAFVYDHDGFDRALDLLVAGRLPVDLLIDDEEYGLDGLAEATHRLAGGEIAGKLMIVPSGVTR